MINTIKPENNDPRYWNQERIAQAYRDEGKTWSEEVLQERAGAVARELQHFRWKDAYLTRKVEKHELPCGHMKTDDDDVLFDAAMEQSAFRGLRTTRPLPAAPGQERFKMDPSKAQVDAAPVQAKRKVPKPPVSRKMRDANGPESHDGRSHLGPRNGVVVPFTKILSKT